MYAPPPAVVPVTGRRTGFAASAPILAICCLLFILFIIAATIILALIPVYLSRRSGTPVQTYSFIIGSNSSLCSNNPCSASDRAALALRIQQAYGFPAGSVRVTSGAAGSGKRKRRGFVSTRNRRQVAFIFIIIGIFQTGSSVVESFLAASGGCAFAASGGQSFSCGNILSSFSNSNTACANAATTAATTLNVNG